LRLFSQATSGARSWEVVRFSIRILSRGPPPWMGKSSTVWRCSYKNRPPICRLCKISSGYKYNLATRATNMAAYGRRIMRWKSYIIQCPVGLVVSLQLVRWYFLRFKI
jgi:hypothetical protein